MISQLSVSHSGMALCNGTFNILLGLILIMPIIYLPNILLSSVWCFDWSEIKRTCFLIKQNLGDWPNPDITVIYLFLTPGHSMLLFSVTNTKWLGNILNWIALVKASSALILYLVVNCVADVQVLVQIPVLPVSMICFIQPSVGPPWHGW